MFNVIAKGAEHAELKQVPRNCVIMAAKYAQEIIEKEE